MVLALPLWHPNDFRIQDSKEANDIREVFQEVICIPPQKFM